MEFYITFWIFCGIKDVPYIQNLSLKMHKSTIWCVTDIFLELIIKHSKKLSLYYVYI